MASRPTKDTPPEKEKKATTATATRGRSPNKPTTTTARGQSPNKPTTATRGRSPNPSPKKPARNNSPSPPEKPEKPVPNYLKPTISNLFSRADENTENPALLRRRSFEKPPGTLQSQRPRGSPSPTFRSSSSKITSPQRRAPDRNLRTTKEAGKQHALYATTKKGSTSTVSTKKNETGDKSLKAKERTVSPRKVEDVSVPNVQDPETDVGVEKGSENHVQEPETQSDEQVVHNGDGTEMEDQESNGCEQVGGENHVEIEKLMISEQICNEEDAENKDGENTVLEHQEPVEIEQAEGGSEDKDVISEGIEEPLVEDQESIDVKQTEEDSEQHMDTKIDSEHQNDKIEAVDESLEAPENQDTCVGVNTEEAVDTEEKELNEDDIISETKQEINSDEIVADKITEEVEGEEEMGLSKEDEPASGDGACEAEEKDEQQVTVEKEPEAPKVEVAHENNDTPASNDVVEDTASKLREERRNKVRALAGAFESAIAKQEK